MAAVKSSAEARAAVGGAERGSTEEFRAVQALCEAATRDARLYTSVPRPQNGQDRDWTQVDGGLWVYILSSFRAQMMRQQLLLCVYQET